MSETQKQKKKRKKQQGSLIEQVQEETTIQNAAEVTEALEEIEKQGVRLDIQVCPKCKSPRVRRTKSTDGDMWGHLAMLPEIYECIDCGWQTRLVLKATNRQMRVRDIELIREAMDYTDDK